MTQNSDDTKEINKSKEVQVPPEAAQRGGVIGENVNQAKWRQTQQQHILEQGESATDLFYDPNFRPNDKAAKFELVDDGDTKSGKFIDYKPLQLDKKTFVLGMDHENEQRSGVQKLTDFIAAAAQRASDPVGQQKYIQEELDKIAGIGRGLNSAKEHTKASAIAGWNALTDGTVAAFLSKPNAINDPLFHAVGGVFDAMSKDSHAVDKAIIKVGELIVSSSEHYLKLPAGKQGEIIGETLFYGANPEGSTEAGELAIKISNQVATKVDAAVVAGIEKSVKAAQEMAASAPELGQQAQQMVVDYARQLGLTPQEMEIAGVPRGWLNQKPNLNDHTFAMSAESERAENVGGSAIRRDHDPYSEYHPKGWRKSHINDAGDLVPANPEGIYNGQEMNVCHHLDGGWNIKCKGNSPFTSFSATDGTVITRYGDFLVKLDLNALKEAKSAGLVKVDILELDDVIKAIDEAPGFSEMAKNKHRKWARRDHEILIKGTIPGKFITVEKP